MRHEAQSTYAHQCPGAFGATAGEAPARGLFLLQGRHDDKTPDQLKFDFALWSSKAIKEYVQREYGMSISRRTARRYMQKMGFTCQCPVKAAREQNLALVRKWLETDCPAIRKEAAEKKRPRTAKALKADVVAHLSARKNEPESVRRLFHKKEVRYAAD